MTPQTELTSTPSTERPALRRRGPQQQVRRDDGNSLRLKAADPGESHPELLDLPDDDLDRLISGLLPLVKQMASRFRKVLPTHIEVDDLVAAGSVGLLDAVRKFDVRKRVKITTYARYRIRGAMLDSLRTLDDASRDLRQKKKKVEVVCRELEARFGRPPGDSEIAAELGLSLDGWYRTLHEISALGVDWLRSGRSGNEKVAFGESPDGEDSENPFRRCFLSEQREILQRALAELPERQRLVVLLYTEHGLTMKQIAARLKVGESRVSQIYSAARASLRKRVQGILRQPRHGPPSTIGTTFATGL